MSTLSLRSITRHGDPTVAENDIKKLRVESARAQRWLELDAGKITRHSRRRQKFIGDAVGNLYQVSEIQVFNQDGRVCMNELSIHAFFIGEDGAPVLLRSASAPGTVQELEQLEAARIARLEATQAAQRAEIMRSPRADLTMADLLGDPFLPDLKSAIARLEELCAISFDKGSLVIRLPLNHPQRDEILRAARTVWAAKEHVEAHVAAKRPLSELRGVVLADGTVEP